MIKEIVLFFVIAAAIIAVVPAVFGASLPVMLAISLATVCPLMVITIIVQGKGGAPGRGRDPR